MPPKPKANDALHLSGRPAKADAAPSASAASAKRGRPAKVDVVDEAPKKRGRPAKAKVEEPFAEDAPKKKQGRPSLKAADVVAPTPEDAAPRKRGRPRKEDVVAADALVTPKRGRPARTAALDLNRVAGSSRAGKRTSPRSKAPKPVSLAPRLDPRMRSRLRTRLPHAQKLVEEREPALKPTKRGRPRKAVVEAPAPKTSTGRKATRPAVEEAIRIAKPAKPLAPRKMRGHTVRQIPDKFVAQVDQLLHDLTEEHVQVQENDEAQLEDEIDVQAAEADEEGQEVGLVSSEQAREQYQDQQEYEEGAEGYGDAEQDGYQEEEDIVHEEEEENVRALAGQVDENGEELPEENDENGENGENDEPTSEVEMNVQVTSQSDENFMAKKASSRTRS